MNERGDLSDVFLILDFDFSSLLFLSLAISGCIFLGETFLQFSFFDFVFMTEFGTVSVAD